MSSIVRCCSCIIVVTTLDAGVGQERLEAERARPGQMCPGGVTLFDPPRGRGPWGRSDGGAPLALGTDRGNDVFDPGVTDLAVLIGDQTSTGLFQQVPLA